MQLWPFLTPGGAASSFLLVASLPSHPRHFMHLSLSSVFIGLGNRKMFTWSCFQAFTKQLARCWVLLPEATIQISCIFHLPLRTEFLLFWKFINLKSRGIKGVNQVFLIPWYRLWQFDFSTYILFIKNPSSC